MRLLLMCALVVPACGILARLGRGPASWRARLLFRSSCNTATSFASAQTGTRYSTQPNPTEEGGLHNALPIVLFYQLWAWLGVTPVLAYNLSGFGLQILVAFLGVRATQSLASSWRNADFHWPLLIELRRSMASSPSPRTSAGGSVTVTRG